MAQLIAAYSIPDADIAENIFHVKNSAAWDATQLANLCSAYVAWESSTFAGAVPSHMRRSSVSLIGVSARDLTTETSPEVTFAAGLPIVGTDTGTDLPNGITVAVKFGTGIPGRSFRGRVFWIGIGSAELNSSDKNLISTSYGINLISIYQGLVTAIKAANANWDLSVLSRSNNNVVRANGIATKVNLVALVDGFIDYQRRRAPAHSRHH